MTVILRGVEWATVVVLGLTLLTIALCVCAGIVIGVRQAWDERGIIDDLDGTGTPRRLERRERRGHGSSR